MFPQIAVFRRVVVFIFASISIISQFKLAHAASLAEELRLGYLYKPYIGISYAPYLSTSGGGENFPKIGGFTYGNHAGLKFNYSIGIHAGLRWHRYAAVQFGHSMVGQNLSTSSQYIRDGSLVKFESAKARFSYTYVDLSLYTPHVSLFNTVTLELTGNLGIAYTTCNVQADAISIKRQQILPKYGIGIQIGILGFLSTRIGVDIIPFKNDNIGIKSFTVYSIGVSFYL